MFVVDIHALPNISIISIIYDVDGLSCQNWKIIINDPSIAPLGRDGRVMSWMEIIEYLKFQHIYKSQTVVTLHKTNFSSNWCGICFLYSSKRENFYINSFAWVGLYKSYKTLLETFKRNVFKHFVENFPSLNL